MTTSRLTLILIISALLALLAACAATGKGWLFAHPSAETLGVRPKLCTDCHQGEEPLPFARFNHTPFFLENHRMEAYQYEQTCRSCHREASFCSDCHAVRVELKPSDKNPTANDRRMQHRGDYLSRHRIDGRMDPVSCYRCHGNPKTSQTCVSCHGR